MRPTREDFKKAATSVGGHGFTYEQIKILGANPQRRWLKPLIGEEIPDEIWEAFVRAGDALRTKNHRAAGVECPPSPPTPTSPLAKAASGEAHPSSIKTTLPKTAFIPDHVKRELFASEDWKFARAFILRKHKYQCCHCRTKTAELHVDHIIPITADWSRRLDLLNLQVLCADCNIGKSNFFTG